jgi:hypothetical protein
MHANQGKLCPTVFSDEDLQFTSGGVWVSVSLCVAILHTASACPPELDMVRVHPDPNPKTLAKAH